MEEPDEWLKRGNPWEIVRPEYAVKVKFYGKTYMQRDADGKLKVQWVDTEDVLAMPYDIPIPGYKNDVVNTLRLWSARSTEEFDFEYFNHGDYEEAVHKKILDENISRVLYPNDNVMRGRILRLKQEYFFTAASISDIIRRFKEDNSDWGLFPEKIAIQLNDTHPALSVVELMRIFVDQEGLEWDRAWDITTRTFAYTNHTLMPEALERWSVDIFRELLPRHLEIVYEINQRFLREVANAFPGDTDRLRRMSLIEEGDKQYIRMAYLSIIGSHSVNGVSELHSRLITELLFRDFYELYPEKFNNKTNGITQRRWLRKANTRLSGLITETIGDKWITDLYELRKLLSCKDKPDFHQKWQDVKAANKQDFAAYIRRTMGIDVNPESIFDVQVKRIHEYKRQILFAFYVLDQYLKVKNNPRAFKYPRTFIFSGKAAPGYYMAKLIIRFINSVAAVVNGDRQVGNRMKVVFLENYRVSLAERVFPASDLSEQISTAGYEASGTGCMKFMVNGALTIGTRDGATVEMAQEVGSDNIFLFGLEADDVQMLKRDGYRPQDYISQSPVLEEIFKLIRSNFFSPLDSGLYEPLAQSLMHHDPYLVCADFDDYCNQQDIVSNAYRDQTEWTKKSIVNVASSGKFSGDRTITEYARDIWNVPVHQTQYKSKTSVSVEKTARNRKPCG
jgi:starch phosphorylase